MKSSEKIAAGAGSARPAENAWNVLVVDSDVKVAEIVKKAAGTLLTKQTQQNATVNAAATLDAAEAELSRTPADLIMINLEIDGRATESRGMEIIRQYKRRFPAATLPDSFSRSSIMALSV